jgi:hypothetical protein
MGANWLPHSQGSCGEPDGGTLLSETAIPGQARGSSLFFKNLGEASFLNFLEK